MRERIKEYLKNLSSIGLKDADLNKNEKSLLGSLTKAILTIVCGFPIYIYGLVNNFIPFEIPGFVADKTIKQIEFRGPIGMVTGTFTFLIFYTVQVFFVWKFSHNVVLTIIYFLSLPLSGIFAYWYYYELFRIRSKWILMRIFFTKSSIISKLITERELLLAEFEKGRKKFSNIDLNS